MPAHTNWLLFLGRLHPLLVHLPIGFLAILAAVEVAARVGRFRAAAEARGVILAATAVAAVLSVAAGLMLSSAGGYDPHLLFWHKWAGITLAAFVIATAVAHARHRRRAYAGLLIATLALLVPASHFGGSMTHGDGYLTAYAPGWVRLLAGAPTHRPPAPPPSVADAFQAHLYADLARPVFAQDCISCHGPDRSSGRLRLDSLDAIRQGGQSGPGVVPGNPAVSAVLLRMSLPTSNSKHMPPADQPQPTADQLAAVKWWVSAGADDAAVAAVHPTADQTDLVARLLHVAPKPPAVVDSNPPRPMAEIEPVAADLSAKLGVGLSATAVGQPWLTCTARTARSFGDRDLRALSPLGRNLTSLDLAGTAVTDAGLAALADMPNLRELHLDRTRVTDAGLAALRPLSHLEYLNLYGTAVTDAGLATLRPLPSLHRLYLWRTNVTPAAAAAFADSRVDPGQVREWQRQIADLQARIVQQHVNVVGGTPVAVAVVATTRPAAATTGPAATTRATTRVATAAVATTGPVRVAR
jgi:uncharacterized membrane protein/mono/diheme cytochrome c family protein